MAWVSGGTRQDLLLAGPDGGSPRALSTGERYTTAPRWMPDGAHLVFQGRRQGRAGIWEVALTDAQGHLALLDAESLQVEPLARPGGFPLWLPDGERLLVGTQDRVEILDLASGEGRTLLELTPRTLTVSPPLALAPDQTRFYLSMDLWDADLWLADIEP